MTERAPLQSSATTLRILGLLLRHFAHGLTNKDIAETLRLEPSAVTRHVQVLEAEGFAERIPETGRIRASVRMAQACHAVMVSLESAAARMNETRARITTTLN